MRFFISFSFILASLLSLSGCSLDDRYFQNTRTDSYDLTTSVITTTPETISFSSNGETLYGVFVPAKNGAGATKPTFVYFHGRDKNITKYWPRIEKLFALDVNIFIFDFQGYGRSTGNPSFNAIYQNSRDALAYVKGRGDVNSSKLVYYAYSFGGIFALELAVHQEMPRLLITESIPASSDTIAHSATTLAVPGHFLFDETFDVLPFLQALTCRILLFHGVKDETIPYRDHATRVFAAAPQPKTTVTVPEGDHSGLIDAYGLVNYQNAIQTLLTAEGI